MCQHPLPRTGSVAAEIDKYVSRVTGYYPCRRDVRQIIRQFDETVTRTGEPVTYRAAVIRPQTVANHLEPRTVVLLQNIRHQIG